MAKTTAPLLPPVFQLLQNFGERLRLARLRRRLTAVQVAERAGMSPMTLRSLERGGAGVTLGAYVAVMQVLGIESDIELLAAADDQGRALQDAQLPSARTRVRVTQPDRARNVSQQELPASNTINTRTTRADVQANTTSAKALPAWMASGGFTSAASLAELISPTGNSAPKGSAGAKPSASSGVSSNSSKKRSAKKGTRRITGKRS